MAKKTILICLSVLAIAAALSFHCLVQRYDVVAGSCHTVPLFIRIDHLTGKTSFFNVLEKKWVPCR